MRALVLALAFSACGPAGFRAVEWHPERLRTAGLHWQAREGQGHGPGVGRWSKDHVRVWGEAIELRLQGDVGAEISAALPLGALDIALTLESLDGAFETLDPDLVVGAFVYRNDASECDLELARWGQPGAHNGQLVVASGAGRPPRAIHRFPLRGARARATLRWRGSRLAWHVEDSQGQVRWQARGPRNGGHRLHVNVWSRRPGAGHARVRVRASVRSSASMGGWPTSGV